MLLLARTLLHFFGRIKRRERFADECLPSSRIVLGAQLPEKGTGEMSDSSEDDAVLEKFVRGRATFHPSYLLLLCLLLIVLPVL
jgi:hypothetical protein